MSLSLCRPLQRSGQRELPRRAPARRGQTLSRCEGFCAMWRLMTRSGDRRKPDMNAPGIRTDWNTTMGVGVRNVAGTVG